MKVFLVRDGARHVCAIPFPGCDHVVVTDQPCPHCKGTPFKIGGAAMRPSADDKAYEADAACLNCMSAVGTLRAEMSTLFGVREDEAVLHGRPRVY